MLFAGDGDTTYFYNFKTRQQQTGRKLPAEVLQEITCKKAPPPKKKRDLTTATVATTVNRHDPVAAAREKQRVGHRPAVSHSRQEKARLAQTVLSREEWAVIKASSMDCRRTALMLRPRGLPEILVACRFMGIDVVSEPSLVWLIDCVLACDYLPVGTQPYDDSIVSRDAEYSRAADPRLEKKQEMSALEKLWHLARNGQAPPVYENWLSDTLTEVHPMRSFVKAGVAAQEEETRKAKAREVASKTGFRK